MWNTLQDIAQQLTGAASRDQLRDGEFWALRDVSFKIRQGESVAIIGDNGAGKSTLIKLLMRRMLPTSGLLETRGSISALTVLGLGFDPVLSGRENILLNAATLGLSRRETLQVMDDIIDFAELREFIDTPIQTYSSGMKSRLGYAVAAHVNPDILLLDEVLAVGDIRFRRKCRRHIKQFIDHGGTTLLVTHDLHAAQTLCNRCLVLEKGRLLFDGSQTDGIHFYLESQLDSAEEEAGDLVAPPVEMSTAEILMTDPNAVDGPTSEISAHEAVDSINAVSSSTISVQPPSPLLESESSTMESAEVGSVIEPMPVSLEGGVDWSTTGLVSAEQTQSPHAAESVTGVIEESAPADETEVTALSSSKNTTVVIESLVIHATDGRHLRTHHSAELVMRYRSTIRIDNVAWGITITTEDGQIHICTFVYGYSGPTYSILPGSHAFKIRLDRLPLLAGRYGLKGGIGEVDSGAAIAEKGWEDALVYFAVRAEPSPETSTLANMNNLVAIEGTPLVE